MTPEAFQVQINRLAENFGKNAYSRERTALIWREVQGFDGAWFASVVDRMIGESRYAPLLPEFREEAAKERERLRERERNQDGASARAFFRASSVSGDDARMLIGGIIRRITRQMSDADYAKHLELVRGFANASRDSGPRVCRECDGTGVVNAEDGEGYMTAYRCYCGRGQAETRFRGFEGSGMSVRFAQWGAR